MSGSRVSVPIYDLDRLDKELFKRILASRLDSQKVVEITLGTQTVRAIPFRDEVNILTAALAVDVLRSENRKAKQPEVQVYLKRNNGTWTRIGEGEVLTTQLKGKFVLNQRIFGTNPDDLVPPESKRPARIGGNPIL
jgi:hypothetical protein